MNCYYHTDRNAVIQCKKCGKGLCSDCSHLFKSNLCMDCEKEDIIKKLIISIVMVISGIIIPIVLYFLFENASEIGGTLNEFVNAFYPVARGYLEFPNIASAEIGNGNIVIPEELINTLAPYLLVYIFSSIPFGWYLLNKIPLLSLSRNIIVIAIIAIIKFEISFFLGPIVMPFVVIALIISINKNRKRLLDISVQEKKHFAYLFSNSTELKIPTE